MSLVIGGKSEKIAGVFGVCSEKRLWIRTEFHAVFPEKHGKTGNPVGIRMIGRLRKEPAASRLCPMILGVPIDKTGNQKDPGIKRIRESM